MPTIEKRTTQDGDIRYRAVVRLKGHPVQRATFERKTDAGKWARATESAIREGRYFKTAEAKRHTLTEAIERYLAEVMPHKPKSAPKQTAQLNWWKERIGAYTLADVSAALIIEQRAKLVTDTSAPTANRYMAALGHLLTVCVQDWGWLDDSPMRKVKRMAENRGRVRFLDESVKVDGKGERARLLEACKASTNPLLYDVVVLALSTGARKGELLTLRWADVDFARHQLVFHETKNGERRSAPLVGHAHDCLLVRSKVRRIDTDLVFPQANQPKPAAIDRDFVKACKSAGLDNFHFHDLRHSCASYLAMNGATLAEIAAVLGHKTLSMVQRYSHLTKAHTSSVVERMNTGIFNSVAEIG